MTFFFFFGKHVDTCFKHPLWTVVLILEIQQWVESSPYPCGLYIIITITITANLVWVAVYKGKGEWGMSQAMDHISTLPGKAGSWLFIFSASQEQTKTSEDLELLWSEPVASPWAFPTVLVWVLWSPGCLLTDHRVELCSVCEVFQIACGSGNCYWCSQLFTNVAATVISALIFFQSPFAL